MSEQASNKAGNEGRSVTVGLPEAPKVCPVCGERDPYPQWFCLFRAAGVAIPGNPCSYSLDGAERMKASYNTAGPQADPRSLGVPVRG
jgi:hypothetical protein